MLGVSVCFVLSVWSILAFDLMRAFKVAFRLVLSCGGFGDAPPAIVVEAIPVGAAGLALPLVTRPSELPSPSPSATGGVVTRGPLEFDAVTDDET